MTVPFLLLLIAVSVRTDTDAQSRYQRESDLHYDLLKDYAAAVKPTSGPVQVYIKPDALVVQDMDESIDVVTVTLIMQQYWVDSRLSWEPSAYGNISHTMLALETVWKPDLELYNIFRDSPGPLYEGKAVSVFNGTMVAYPVWRFESYCPLDLTYFPFDTQTCALTFGSSSHDTNDMVLGLFGYHNETSYTLTIPPEGIGYSFPMFHNPSWALQQLTVSLRTEKFSCCQQPRMLADVTLTLERKTSFLRVLMVGPMVTLSILVPGQFLLPTRSSQRSTFGILLIACYVMSLTAVQQYSPFEHSSISKIGMLQSVMLVFCTVAAILSAIITSVAYKGTRRKSVPYWVHKIFSLKVLRRMLWLGESPYSGNLYTSVNTRISTIQTDDITSQSNGRSEPRDSGDRTSGSDVHIRSAAKSLAAMAANVIEEDALEKLKHEWDDVCIASDRICFLLLSFMVIVTLLSLIALS